jgi:hypothetical protein
MVSPTIIFESTIYDWLLAVSGFSSGNIYRANQDIPRPNGNIITYQVISEEKNQYPETRKASIDDHLISAIYNYFYSYTVSINIYSKTGRDTMRSLGRSFDVFSHRKILRDSGFVLLSSGSIRDLTSLGDTGYRARFQSDFVFRAIESTSEQYEKIKSFELVGNFGELETTLLIGEDLED